VRGAPISKSSAAAPARKRAPKFQKPYKDFPLGIHKGSGHWCKKVWGKVHSFGRAADDPNGVAALAEWHRVKDDLYAGRTSREHDPEGLTVAQLCNHFLTHQKERQDNGAISPLTFRGHHAACDALVKVFGKGQSVPELTPDDFAKLHRDLARSRGAVALRNEMQRCRSVFKFAFDNDLILKPVKFATQFK
jgi:hypothetical protein